MTDADTQRAVNRLVCEMSSRVGPPLAVELALALSASSEEP
jgi:hypothetical protein